MRFQRRSALLLALGLTTGAFGSAAPPVSAATDQLRTKAVTTYDPQPARGVVHVTQVMTLTNRAPSTSRNRSCTQTAFDTAYGYYTYTTTCTTRTDYYYDWYEFSVERDATSIKAKANTGTARIKPGKRSGDWRRIRVLFTPLYYGRTRTLTVTYDLPAGGPRSTAERRVGAAFAAFCVTGPGTEVGTVRVRIPAGFAMGLSRAMKDSVSGNTRTYTTGAIKEPWKFLSCLTGVNEAGYDTTEITAPDGATVKVEAWRDDPLWAEAVRSAVSEDLPALRAFVDAPSGPAILTVRESEASAAATNWYNPAAKTLQLSEAVATRAAVTHRMGIALFDGLFSADWLTHGYASWAAREAGVSDEPCAAPGAYPGVGTPYLARWLDIGGAPTEAKLATDAWQRQAACSIVATIGDAIGPEAMHDTLERMRSGEPAYPSTDLVAATEAGPHAVPLDWRGWLDLITERGLIPAGADLALATDPLVAYGIASDDGQFAARADALDAYHAFLAMTSEPAPVAVTQPLSDWAFDDASAAISSATAAWRSSQEVVGLIAGAKVDDGPVRSAIQAAVTPEDLELARAMADDQLALATVVAGTQAAVAAPRGVVEQVGMVGATLPEAAIGIEAVERIDGDAATQYDADVRAILAASSGAGAQRIAIVALLVALVSVAIVTFATVRRRRRRGPTVAPAESPPT